MNLYYETIAEQWFINSVEKGIQAAETGKLITQDEMKKKWEMKRAAAIDRNGEQ